MKKKTRNKLRILTLTVICLSMAFMLFSCDNSAYQDEINAIHRFMKYHENPDCVVIDALEKYEISEKEIFYYVKWRDTQENSDEVYEVLLVYDTSSTLAKLRHFSDMEQGLFSEVKSKWDNVKGTPDQKFTSAEISKIKQESLLLNINK